MSGIPAPLITMTPKRITLIQGHPDAAGGHLCHALAEHYATGARLAGHEVRTVDIAHLDFPLLRSAHAWTQEPVPECLKPAQDAIQWAEHLVFIFPLWLGDMPALLKGFLEQIAREGFAFARDGDNPMGRKLLAGRSARVMATMGMPAVVYRWYFRAHSIKSLERNILGFVGISPVEETLIGSVEQMDAKAKSRLFSKIRNLGRDAG